MALRQTLQYSVVKRLHGARDEQTARSRQLRQDVAMLQQMLDLDRDVVRHRRKLRMKRLDDGERVSWTVQKIGVAESNMLSPGGDLLPDICQHHLSLHDAESPLIHRHDRAVPAQVL